MAMKNDFEATSDIHSPFVDEVANRGVRGPIPDPGIVDPKKGPTVGKVGTPFTKKERAFLAGRNKPQTPTKTAFTGDTRITREKLADKAAALAAAKRSAGGR